MIKKYLFKLIPFCMLFVITASILVGCGDGASSSKPAQNGETVSGEDLPDFVFDGSNGGGAVTDASGNPVTSPGGNSGSPATPSGNNSGNNPGGNIFADIPKELQGTTVTVANWGDEGAAEYVKVAKQFTKDTGINVKWVSYNQVEYVANVIQQIAANAGPDVVILQNTFPTAIEMVQPLPASFNLNDGFWDKRVSDALSVNGKYYFVNSYNSPFTGGTVVYYNKKIFNDNGLTSPQDYYDQGKWTYENLEKCMQQVKKVGYTGGILESMVIAEQMGSSLIQYDKASGSFKGNAKDNNLVKALQYMSGAVEQGLAGGYTTANFASGQVGICMSGTYGLKYNGYLKDMKPSEIGVVPLPNSYEGKKLEYLPLGLRGYGVAKGAKNAAGSYYFLRYFLDYGKYAKAGANIFGNKVLEKYFVETQLPLFKNAKLYFQYYHTPLEMVGKPWSGADWTNVRHAAGGQIAVELDKMTNICNNAASAATEKLKSLK